MKLNTIQKRNKLNLVKASDLKGNGGAYHKYTILRLDGDDYKSITEIQFQNGARNTQGAIQGVLDVDLLEICRHRLQCFQKGEFATRENAIALTHVEEALLWLNKRIEDRADKNVLGTNKK